MINTTNELAGRMVAGCELIRQLGGGNNGVVYLAHQKKLNRHVACKIISPDLLEDPDFLDTLYAEAANAAKFTHPNIIQALDAGDDNGLKYFMMEYVDGASLEYIRANNPEMISTEFLLKIALQLVDAMDYAWSEHKIIHGDIKPGNLMITRNTNKLKIGDLGFAHSANGSSGAEDDVMITPLYAAPEVISTQKPSSDPRSDIYSFGIMFYELACGKAPFSGTVEELLMSHLNQMPLPLFTQNPDMDKELSLLVDSMIAKNPDDRPANWKALKASLLEVYNRLYPAVKTPEIAKISSSAPKNTFTPAQNHSRTSSWSAEEKKKTPLLEKYPWMLPVLLLILIVIALTTIPFSLGLFK